MVFFNYSTMQMAAKIVYYGPGLCGKTTNLQYVYGHTSTDSRGEMVSLETETDRTLFFDLLPIDVGTIAGFRTKIQLYTVPGQVFYNTTRKLVLKGVDGVVFVADSQRPMLQANIDAFQNLEENLAEIGLTVKEVPLVLQFNKRDLRDVLTVKELNDALNRHDWPCFEASALEGQGVFETLKGISKLTLLSIKQKMQRTADKAEKQERPGPEVIASATQPSEPRPVPASNPTPSVIQPSAASAPATSGGSSVATAERAEEPRPESDASADEQRQVDVLAELEKIRRQATSRERAATPKPAAARNGHGELSHAIRRNISRTALARTRRLSLVLQLEDEDDQIVDAVRERVRLDHPADLEKLLLKLDIALDSGG